MKYKGWYCFETILSLQIYHFSKNGKRSIFLVFCKVSLLLYFCRNIVSFLILLGCSMMYGTFCQLVTQDVDWLNKTFPSFFPIYRKVLLYWNFSHNPHMYIISKQLQTTSVSVEKYLFSPHFIDFEYFTTMSLHLLVATIL